MATGNAPNAVTAVLILGSLIYRYRLLPASPQREQVAWAMAAAILLAGAPWLGLPSWPLSLETVPTGFFAVKVFGTFLFVGALTCLAVALLSDELFRAEVVLTRALVYGLLSLFVVASYVLVVGYLSLIFQSSGSLWLSLVATGLVAVQLQRKITTFSTTCTGRQ